VVDLPAVPLAQLLAWAARHGDPRTPASAWLDPEGHAAWAALGARRTLVADDLAALAHECSTLAELVAPTDLTAEAGDPDLPLAVVGARFDPRRPPAEGDPWRGWRAAWATLPERLVHVRRADGRTRAVLHLPEDEALEPALARLRAELAPRSVATPAAAESEGRRVAEPFVEGVEAWRARVEAALEAIEAGALEKVVLARAEVREAPAGWDVAATLGQLATLEGTARFAVAPGGDARGWFVGASPELLARVRGGRLETVALAGTCPRGATPPDDDALGAALRASDKDLREHALVVEALRADLAQVAPALEVAAAPSLRRLAHVQHLETRVAGALAPGAGLLQVAARLHPTPARAGAPRAAARRWLREREPIDRGWFGGAVGWLDAQGGGALAVAIRSALLLDRRALLFAGAGIVRGSAPQAEWDETALKLRTAGAALVARRRPLTREALVETPAEVPA
jgi:isochorismate synthase